MNTLGITIRDARERKRLSQASLAKRVGSSRATISRLEITGITSTDLLERIADELELDELPLGTRKLQAGALSADELADALQIAIAVLDRVLNALERRGRASDERGDIEAIDAALSRLATLASANRSAASPAVRRATRRISIEAPRGRYEPTETAKKGSDRKR